MKHLEQPGRHRAQRGRRTVPGKRRAEVRPRYGRIAVVTASAVVTAVAVLGGFGVLPSGPEDANAGAVGAEIADAPDPGQGSAEQGQKQQQKKQRAPALRKREAKLRVVPSITVSRQETEPRDAVPPLPAGSGTGRRIVFSEGEQRVWLVDAAGVVLRSYLVSGSIYDNLDPGTYRVFSRSRYAVGIDDSGTMEYFVRFTHGDAGAAIGFHTIPVDDGEPVQTLDQLGTPLSHGCIRQRKADAVALWDFAPVGTTVVVTA